MSSPTVSYLINRGTDGEPVVAHWLNGPDVQNSHGIIAQKTGVNHGTALCVEIEPKELAAKSNAEPVPWQIDRLPDGKSVIEDVNNDLIDAAENAARHFMTPENVYAYIHTRNRDTEHFVNHVFTNAYYRKWCDANPTTHTVDADPLRHTSHMAQALINTLTGLTDPLIRPDTNIPAPTNIPMFTKADIVNPATWWRLPE